MSIVIGIVAAVAIVARGWRRTEDLGQHVKDVEAIKAPETGSGERESEVKENFDGSKQGVEDESEGEDGTVVVQQLEERRRRREEAQRERGEELRRYEEKQRRRREEASQREEALRSSPNLAHLGDAPPPLPPRYLTRYSKQGRGVFCSALRPTKEQREQQGE